MDSLPGSYIATGRIPNAGTAWRKDPLSMLFGLCEGAMNYNKRVFIYGDKLIRVNLHWIRDYILTMKGFRYTEKDLRSFPDLLLDCQHPKGFFYEIIAPLTDIHSGHVIPGKFRVDGSPCRITSDECVLHEEGCRFGLTRLELEADIEYLMVEGVHMIWQATGDDAWMIRQLPRLEKGLAYMMSDPLRWDNQYELAKRPRTLDTWDFLDREDSSYDRAIRDDDPMGIFHGDNTGLYNALMLMAMLYRVVGDEDKARKSEATASELRERIMKHLWNGQFFRHFLALTPVDYGVDETWQLSLSNAYALNRGILTLQERQSIIKAYQALRVKYGGELDDFRNLDPPYPCFKLMKPGVYVNGAIAPFVAGQLALGAFESGMEAYGVDILDRMGCKILQDGKLSFLYNWSGVDVGGGPRCWCGAELLHAFCQGLAGVRDNGKLFEDVTISPRFVAANEPEAVVRLEYPSSGAFAEYEFRADYENRRLEVVLKSSHKRVQLRMYLPDDAKEKPVASRTFVEERVDQSRYLVFENPTPGERIVIEF